MVITFADKLLYFADRSIERPQFLHFQDYHDRRPDAGIKWISHQARGNMRQCMCRRARSERPDFRSKNLVRGIFHRQG